MLKKKNKLQKQLLIKYNYAQLFLENLLNSSLKKNHYLDPLNRISYLVNEDYVNNLFFKFSTYQKLLCPISLSHKVPNKSYMYSRFFLNKQLDKLVIANTFK